MYISEYKSPIGNITLDSDGTNLTGLRFESEERFESALNEAEKTGKANRADKANKDLKIFTDTKRWLDIYFSGREPDFNIPIRFDGSDFQNEVWNILCTIPYGQTMTYGEIAKIIAERRGIARMSAQAVGGAVGSNRISIIIPCHRVIGADRSLVGYGGGIDKKIALLSLEKISFRA